MTLPEIAQVQQFDEIKLFVVDICLAQLLSICVDLFDVVVSSTAVIGDRWIESKCTQALCIVYQ